MSIFLLPYTFIQFISVSLQVHLYCCKIQYTLYILSRVNFEIIPLQINTRKIFHTGKEIFLGGLVLQYCKKKNVFIIILRVNKQIYYNNKYRNHCEQYNKKLGQTKNDFFFVPRILVVKGLRQKKIRFNLRNQK